MYPALVVGFVLMLGKFFDWWFFSMLSRPIFLVPIVGLLLGDLTTGIVIGASLELIFLGITSIGGVVPQDIIIGSVFASALAIVYDQETSVAVALAVPLSLLGALFWNFYKSIVTFLAERFEKLIEEKNIGKFKRLWGAQYASFLISYFLIGFLGFLLGSEVINAFVQSIPEWINSSLTVAAGMLPAIGMVLLMSTLWDNGTAPYFFIGFALVTFFGGNLISVAFVGVALAAIIAFNDMKKVKTTAGGEIDNNISNSSKEDDDLEGFFNE